MSFAWTDADVERLRVGLLDGLSFSRIAADIGRGVTTNACIGKAHRKGLSSSGRIVANDPRRREHRAKAAAEPPQPRKAPPPPVSVAKHVGRIVAVNAIVSANSSPLDHGPPALVMPRDPPPIVCDAPVDGVDIVGLRRRHCKWIAGEPIDARYCGATRTANSPYCSHHFGMSITRQFTPAERAANAASRSKRALAPVHQRT